ncbi:AT-rich interactive domain-containing protein 5B-like protein, partial [Leptotrombidium deliense]
NTSSGPSVIVISYPRYCRYRALLKRLEGKKNDSINKENSQSSLNSADGLQKPPCSQNVCPNSQNQYSDSHISAAKHVNVVRILFCRETFEHEGLLHHDLNCEHLAPKLKGRPRKKGIRSQRSSSPESNTSEETKCSDYKMRSTRKKSLKAKNGSVSSALPHSPSEEESKTDLPLKSLEKCLKSEQEFIKQLYKFMKEKNTPIQRIPHLGFKKIDLFYLYTYAQKLGGYDKITCNKMWKRVYDELGGDPRSTSAATCTRRHYERLLLPFERYINYLRGKDAKQKVATKRGKKKSTDDEETKDNNNNAPNIPKKRGRKPKYLKVQIEKESENSVKESSQSSSENTAKDDVKSTENEEQLSKADVPLVENVKTESEEKVKSKYEKTLVSVVPPIVCQSPQAPKRVIPELDCEKKLDDEKCIKVKEESKPFLEPLRIVRNNSVEQLSKHEMYVCVKDSLPEKTKKVDERIESIPIVKQEVMKLVGDEKNNGNCDNLNGVTSKSPLLSITSLIASMDSKSLVAPPSDKTLSLGTTVNEVHQKNLSTVELSSKVSSSLRPSVIQKVESSKDSTLCKPCLKVNPTYTNRECDKKSPSPFKPPSAHAVSAHTVSAVKRSREESCGYEILDLSVKKRFSEADSRTSPSKPVTEQIVQENGAILDLSVKKKLQTSQNVISTKTKDSFPVVMKVPKKCAEEALPQNSHLKVTPVKPQILSAVQSQFQNQIQTPPKLVPTSKETYYPDLKSSRIDFGAAPTLLPNGSGFKPVHNYASFKPSTTPPSSSPLRMPPALIPTHQSKICAPICDRTMYDTSTRHHSNHNKLQSPYNMYTQNFMRNLNTAMPSISDYNPTLPTFHISPFDYLQAFTSPTTTTPALPSNAVYHQNGDALRAMSAPLMPATFSPLHPLAMENVAYRKMIEQKACVYPYFVTK